MDPAVVLVVALALGFAFTNGVQDAANAIATLVATRAGRPLPALAMVTVVILAAPLLVGAAVAQTISTLVELPPEDTAPVLAAGLASALAWNGAAWARGIPSSSTHALVGGLSGAAVAAAGPDAVAWGGLESWRPGGVAAVLVALAVSPLLGAGASFLALRGLRRALRRGTRRLEVAVRRAQWIASTALAAGQGANDVQKAVGVVGAALAAGDDVHGTPRWAVAGAAAAMAAGTALGGWRIVRTIGKRIYDLRSLDALASQASSATVLLGASVAGAPVSATHVVASSVVGVGGARRRWGRVRWRVVEEIAVAWATTLPATALLAAAATTIWRWIA
ncbi:MAG: inorganic phosphate transporter [Thermoleophilia bacterium]|nr:inorganic phosphate transporter [Gaiellaceae bacterium]MDW8338066.1 inorganic phosphate transporter [Thermoleophilia bacterium]